MQLLYLDLAVGYTNNFSPDSHLHDTGWQQQSTGWPNKAFVQEPAPAKSQRLFEIFRIQNKESIY